MICLIALPVLAILGIFSTTHRRLFFEALDCVFRKATLRKCQSRLDERLKSKVSGKLFNHAPRLGKFVFRNFEIISWIFVILLITSLVFSAQGIYNYVKYGNCNGPHSKDFCIFNFGKTELSCGSDHCAEEGCDCGPKDTNCTEENNHAACNGNCDCYEEVCG